MRRIHPYLLKKWLRFPHDRTCCSNGFFCIQFWSWMYCVTCCFNLMSLVWWSTAGAIMHWWDAFVKWIEPFSLFEYGVGAWIRILWEKKWKFLFLSKAKKKTQNFKRGKIVDQTQKFRKIKILAKLVKTEKIGDKIIFFHKKWIFHKTALNNVSNLPTTNEIRRTFSHHHSNEVVTIIPNQIKREEYTKQRQRREPKAHIRSSEWENRKYERNEHEQKTNQHKIQRR